MYASWSLTLSLSLFILKKHVYVQVVVIVAHIFPWFYIQERLKRPLYGSRIGFPSSFLKNWQTRSFLVRFPRLCRRCSLWNCGHKSWIARCTSPLRCISRVNRRLSKDPLLRPSLQIPFLKNDMLHYKSIWHICDRLLVVLHDISLQKCFYLSQACMKWKN